MNVNIHAFVGWFLVVLVVGVIQWTWPHSGGKQKRNVETSVSIPFCSGYIIVAVNVQCPIVHAFQDGSWWCWWLFLDMRTKWKKASARPRIGSNRALRQRPTNSLLQTSKPGRSLFVLGVFFFVLSFRLLLLLDLLGVFGFACLYRDL